MTRPKQNEKIPEVTHSGRLTIDGLDIEVLTLDNGKRVIPKDDMIKAMRFIGLPDEEINTLLNMKMQNDDTGTEREEAGS